MIRSFGDDATADVFNGRNSARARRFPQDARRIAEKKLDMLDGARGLEDLRCPPGNRLEAMKGDRAGMHSIRVNDRWRLVFLWTETGPAEIVLEDCH